MRSVLFATLVLGLTTGATSMARVDYAPLAREAIESKLGSGPERQPGDERPLVIFYIHGWTGNSTSFCDLPAILERVYNKDGKTRVIGKSLSYTTASDTMTTTDFAREIYPQMVAFFKEKGLKADNPYSLIMHSQGGIVGVKFVQICVKQKSTTCSEGTGDFGTLTNLRHFIALASPFWGSSNVGYYDFIRQYVDLPFPVKQTSELSIGSLGLTTNREYLIHSARRQQRAQPGNINHRRHGTAGTGSNPYFPDQTQVYVVAGDISDISMTGFIDPLEFDIAVDLPNTRLDFNYYFERSSDDKEPLQGYQFVTREWKPLLVAHSPLDVLGVKRVGIACISNADVDPKNVAAVHPAYPFIKKWVDRYFGTKEPMFAAEAADKALVHDVINFGVEFKLRLPENYRDRQVNISDEDIQMSVNPREISRTRHGNTLVSKIHGTRQDDPGKNRYITYYHVGDMTPEFAYHPTLGDDGTPKTAYIDYTIRAKGFQEKKLRLPVNAGRTTYVNIYLKPLAAQDDSEILSDGTDIVYLHKKDYARAYEMWTFDLASPSNDLTVTPITAAQYSERMAGRTRQCSVAHAEWRVDGKPVRVDRHFAEDSQPLLNLEGEETVYVLGRVHKGDINRYLVTSPRIMMKDFVNADTMSAEKGIGWVDATDLDVLPEWPCPFN